MTRGRQRLALGVVCLSVVLMTLSGLSLNLALPTLARDLHASEAQLQWIVSVYLLAVSSLLLTSGSIADRFGRARTLCAGLVIFGMGSAAAGLSTDAGALIICRALMGIGAGLIAPASFAVLANIFSEPKERARAYGAWVATAGLGFALGPAVGGVLLSEFGWSSIFLVNVPIVAIALGVGRLVIPESRDATTAAFDPLGAGLSIVSVLVLVWSTIEAPTQGWGSLRTTVSFGVALGFLVLFIVWERHSRSPMLDLTFYRKSDFSVGSIGASAASFTYAGVIFILAQVLQFVFGYSPFSTGIRLVPLALMFSTGGFLSPRIAERVGTKRTIMVGFVVYISGLITLVATLSTINYGLVMAATMAVGAGHAVMHTAATNAVLSSVPHQKGGIAAGTLGTTSNVGQALGVAVFGSALVSGYHAAAADATRRFALDGNDRERVRESLRAAVAVAHRLGGATGRGLREAARDAYMHGTRASLIVGALFLTAGVVCVARFLPSDARDVRSRVVDEAPTDEQLGVLAD